MFPVLFEIPVFGGLKVYTYGVLVASAFLMGILWTTREARLAGFSKEKVLDLSFYIILAALVGSRILYIIANWGQYASSPLEIFKIWKGGLVFYGGLLGAVLVSLFFARKQKIRFLTLADLFMPGVALGHSIGRLGCLASGCCFGKETADFFGAITFPNIPSTLAPVGIPIYPTQIMESLAAFFIFLILIRVRQKKKFEGQIFLVYLLFYSVARSILEIFRGDEARNFVVPEIFSTSQFISLLLFLFGLIVYWKARKGPQAS